MDTSLVWAEVNLEAIAHNVNALRGITKDGCVLMAVVKANAYGHGAVKVAQQALKKGAERLGVARLQEGITLRKAGLACPILIFGYTPPELGEMLIKYRLTQTVYSLDTAEALAQTARSLGRPITIHVKVDTGMGRLGVLAGCLQADALVGGNTKEVVQEILSISRLPALETEGLYTHFASADSSDKSYTRQQFAAFLNILDALRTEGFDAPIRHAANSAALIDFPESHLDMVRPGIALYGLYPSADVQMNRVSLKPAMALKARIIHLKEVSAGFPISYGMTHVVERPTRIATVPVGYADGLGRVLSSRGHMLVRGRKAPIVGRVCMDLTMLDVGHIPDVQTGDEVVIFGEQGGAAIPVEEVASQQDTINYEVVSTLMERVPRIYV